MYVRVHAALAREKTKLRFTERDRKEEPEFKHTPSAVALPGPVWRRITRSLVSSANKRLGARLEGFAAFG